MRAIKTVLNLVEAVYLRLRKRVRLCSRESYSLLARCSLFWKIKGEANISLLIVALISSANYHLRLLCV